MEGREKGMEGKEKRDPRRREERGIHGKGKRGGEPDKGKKRWVKGEAVEKERREIAVGESWVI